MPIPWQNFCNVRTEQYSLLLLSIVFKVEVVKFPSEHTLLIDQFFWLNKSSILFLTASQPLI